ncbi:multiple RNA-binding domain-containing protein 1 [Yamadazyma tenuis ATCC 10573]|uniref:Multiple RNA-binding domain-containing protein 1 n=1 Tax=Candida tenuis (strain ATCC 10573 / BCRC 21748 / CBS 615 / JCM 9827 / NBRC 10315 / NRRL Y-1498 / VKM Y-70) TaxID=590646 RepID=G3B500_CANTC|nr:multiple RNA-binding domain-containing protein 1 [Yamadazyma tenuis ATCC 10573]EGV64027.1 multiple RNA-binding domain-containing protein 1 [Yamadazyma tenuis ATCC 10573]
MSRLIVKGLPQYLTEDKLKSHFDKHGDVSDIKLMKKRNGESRRFAFIGYKSPSDAESAVTYFNNSFIDTARISVEVAKSFADPTVPMSMKDQRKQQYERLMVREERLLQQEEERKLKKQRIIRSKVDDQIEKNPQLKEFVQAMKPSSQTKSWANDDLADGSGGPSVKALEEALAKQDQNDREVPSFETMSDTKVKENESDAEYDDFAPKGTEVDEDDEVMMPLNTFNKELPEKEMIPNEEDEIAKDEKVTDLEWLQQRRIRMIENRENQIESKPEEKHDSAKAPSRTKPSVDPEVETHTNHVQKINETGRLFIRNISYTSTEEEFRELFASYGNLEEVHVAIDTRTGKSKGFVYIQFTNPEDAVKAYEVLDKEIFQGRLLHILPAEKKKDHRMDEFDLQNLPLKKQRELKKKAQAAKTQFSWNALYMNQDAILESVAAKMGVAKSQLINAQSSDSAVKQALAEAHVIGDVRKYFESKGVDLMSFNKKERDDKVILVKNFSFGTTLQELGEMFSQYGEVKRMLMPPAGTIAIVEFRDAPSARSAFTKLAYKRSGKSILYLEKGPKDLFTREATEQEAVEVKEESTAVEAKVSAKDILMEETKPQDDEEVVAETDGPTVSVFVKNLNFSTTTEQLAKIFKSLPGFAVALVKTKPDAKNPNSTLSMGFGFVEFRTKEDANKAISLMDGHVLDGHKLQLKLSNRTGATSGKKTKGGKKSTKIIIKNLPFEATRKDIIELFGAFGQIKSARVPKKFDRSARGFAFVEFSLLKEAENAMNQLEGVHLLGRRLVMDYAEKAAEDADAEIERMTSKVKQQYATQQLAAQRLAGQGKKLDLDEDEASEF